MKDDSIMPMERFIRVDTAIGFSLSEEERSDCEKWCNNLLREGIMLVAGDVICVNERDEDEENSDWWFCRIATRTFGQTWGNKIQISYFVEAF